MKKLVFCLVAVVLLATSLTGAVSAADPSVPVYPYEDGNTFNVPAGSQVDLMWAWFTHAPGVLNVFLNGFTASYKITNDTTGQVVFYLPAADAAKVWGPSTSIAQADAGFQCPGPNVWYSFWERGGIELQPGQYTLVTDWAFLHPMTDNMQVCYDSISGQQIAPPPSLYSGSGQWVVHLNVQ